MCCGYRCETVTVLAALTSEPCPGGWNSRGIYEPVGAAILHYAARHYDRDGRREFVHSVTGVRTLADEFDKVANHSAHHLEQIRAALAS